MKNLTKKIARLAAILGAGMALLASLGPASAAGDGRLGGTSSGSIALRVFVPNSFRVRGVQGVTVDEFDGPQVSDDGRVCVHSNMTEAYTLQASFRTGRFALVDSGSRDVSGTAPLAPTGTAPLAPPGTAPLAPTATPVAYTPTAAANNTANTAPRAPFCRRGTVLSIKSLDGGPSDPSAAFLKTGTVIMTVVPE